MTTFSKQMIVAAAALAMAAGTASAQTLKAEIPFAFEVAGKTLPAGRYDVSQIETNVYNLRSTDNRNSVLAEPIARQDPQKAWRISGKPKLAFACSGERCRLVELWNGGATADRFYWPKSLDMGVRIAVVEMRSEGKAD